MTIIQPQSPETNLVGTIVNENVETDSLIIYASFRDKKTGDPRTPDPKTKLFVMDKDDSKFEIILADSHTTTDGVTTIVVNTTGRGVNKYGNLSGSGIGFRHTIGKEIGVADIHTYVEIINDIIRGTNATGSNIFRVGKEDNGDVTLYFQKDDEAIPFIRYDVSENKLVYSNNGVDTLDVGGGTGTITGGEGIGIEAGVVNVEGGVQVDDEDSAGYLEDKVTGENGIEIETVGSTDKDINIKLNDTLKANLDTLTDGSVADSLHTHSALGVITATAGEDIDGSTTPKACFIGGGDVDTTVSVEIDQTSQNSNFNLNATTNRISQSVYFQKIGTFTELKIRAGKFGSPSNLICDLYLADSNDKPTGSSLANATGSESAGVVTFTFSYSVTNQLQKYVLVIKGGATANASNYYSVMYQDSDVYTKGLARTSTDSGTIYGDSVGDIYFEITGYLGLQVGLVYLSSSIYRNIYIDGFVTSSVAFLANASINPVEATTFSGLTSGAVYGISTNGSIATTLGLRRIGIALSSTKLYIDKTLQDVYSNYVQGYGVNGIGFGVSSEGGLYVNVSYSEPNWTMQLYKKNINNEYESLSDFGLTGATSSLLRFDYGSTVFILSLTEFIIVPYGTMTDNVAGIGLYVNNGVCTLITGGSLYNGYTYRFAMDSNFDIYSVGSYGSTYVATKYVLSSSKTSATATTLTPAVNFDGLAFLDKDYLYTNTSGYFVARSKTNGTLVQTSNAPIPTFGNYSRSPMFNRKTMFINATDDIVRQYPI